MVIKKRSFYKLFFALVVVGFIGQGASLVSSVITPSSRWVLLLILFLYLFINKRLLKGLPNGFSLIFFIYLFWCVLTTLWSEVFVLSFAKSSLLFVVSITLISAGQEWVRRYEWQSSLEWLSLLTLVALLSGILGHNLDTSNSMINHITIYQGLTGNSNLFGGFQAMIFPFILWEFYKNRNGRRKKLVWGACLFLSLIFLLKSYSRSSILMVLCVLFFFLLSLNMKKKIISVSICFVIATGIFFLSTLSINSLIYKGERINMLASREKVWERSYQQALQGGWAGGGYGVTIGESQFEMVGLSAMNYGREKSNSQLGIIEETGVIGFCLYLILLSVYFFRAFLFYALLHGPEKILMGILLGSLVGIVMQSIFEAWWDSPASPESFYFWTSLGISIGLMKKLRAKLSYDDYVDLKISGS